MGSRQQSRFIAMMEDYDRTMELVETAQDSAGRSSEQFAKYQDTIEYKLNQLKNSWEQFRTSLVKSNTFGKVIEEITHLVKQLNKLDKKQLLGLVAVFATTGRMAVQAFADQMIKEGPKITQGIGNMVTNGINSIKKKFSKESDKTIISIGARIKEDQLDKDLERLIIEENKIDNNIKMKVQFNDSEAQNFNAIMVKTREAIQLAAQEGRQITFTQAINELSQTDMEVQEVFKSSTKVKDSLHQWASETDIVEGKIKEVKSELSKVGDGKVGETIAQRGSQIGTAFASSFTLATTVVMTNADFGQAFKQSFLPTALSSISTFLSTWLAAVGTGEAAAVAAEAAVTLGISLLISAVINLGALFINFAKENWFTTPLEKAEKMVEISEEINEKSKEYASTMKADAKESKEKVDSMKSLKEEYEELNRKALLTTEEEERYQEIVDQIRDEMPEIVSYYDEQNKKLIVQNDLWDSIIEKQDTLAQKDLIGSTTANAASIGAQYQLNVANEKASKERASALGYTNFTEVDFKDLAENSYVQGGLRNLSYIRGTVAEGLPTYDADFYKRGGSKLLNDDDYEMTYRNHIDLVGFARQIGAITSEETELDDEAMQNVYGVLLAIEDIVEGRITEDNADQLDGLRADYYYQAKTFLADQDDAENNPDAAIEKFDEQRTKDLTDNIAAGIINNKGVSQAIADYYAKEAYENSKNSFSGFMDKLSSGEMSWEAFTQTTEYGQIEQLLKVQDINEKNYQNNLNIIEDALVTQKSIMDLVNDSTLDFNDRQKEIMEELDKDILEKTPEELAKKLEQYKSILGNDVINAYKEESEELQGTIEERLKSINEVLGTNFDSKDWSYEVADAYWTNLKDAMKVLGDEKAADLYAAFNNVFEDYDLDLTQRNNLLSFDWNNITLLNYDDYKEKFIAMCEDLGIEGAEGLYDEMLAKSQSFNYTDLTNIDETKLTEYVDSLQELADEAWKAEGTFVKALTTSKTNEALDPSDYEEIAGLLEKWGYNAEDYIKVMEDGSIVVTNEEELSKVYYDQLDVVKKQIKAKKDLIESSIENLKLERDKLETELKITDEEHKQLVLQKAFKTGDYNTINAINNGTYKDNFAKEQKEKRKTVDEIDKQIDDYQTFLNTLNDLDKKQAQIAKTRAKKTADDITDTVKKAADERAKAEQDAAKKIEDAAKKVEDAWNKVADAQKKVQESLDKIAEAEQKVVEKTEELNKILYGDGTYRSSLDPMYNFKNQEKELEERFEEAKEKIENPQVGDDYQKNLNNVFDLTHKQIVNWESQIQVNKSAENATLKALQESLPQKIAELNAKNGTNIQGNFSDFISDNGYSYGVNFDYQNIKANPELLEEFNQMVQDLNSYRETDRDLAKKMKDSQKELLKIREDAINKRVQAEEKLAKYLEEQDKKELERQKEKYDAMKEANDDYLNALEDAINKEKELRNKQNEWDSLATKEKKLSLMQRDTSGANQKEVLQLEQEVQTDREKLLDDSIQEIIDSMKELYDLQQETREMEIEYQEKLIESTQYMKIAEQMINSFETEEDAIEKFLQVCLSNFGDGVTSFNDLTEAQQMQLSATVDEITAGAMLALEVMNSKVGGTIEDATTNIENITTATTEEVSQNIINNSENLTTKAEYDLNQVIATVDDAIEKGKQAIVDAVQEVQNARDNYLDALKDLEEAIKNAKDMEAEAAQTKADYEALINDIQNNNNNNNNNTSSSDDSPSRDGLVEHYNKERTTASPSVWGEIDAAAKRDGLEWNETYHTYLSKYASGGLVDYTGPAWVDGTPSKPEAFLSADDTQRIGLAAQLLSKIPLLSGDDFSSTSTSITNSSVTNEGSLVEVHINIESISNDLDLDNALDKMKNAIWDAAKPAGSAVILSK